jgi:hypothetical protein
MLTRDARCAGRSDRSNLTLGSCRTGWSRFSALTQSALHSDLATLARGAGHSRDAGHSRLSGGANLSAHALGTGWSLQSSLTLGSHWSGRTLRADWSL